ncbi:MAG: FkbM family methyltransferase [Pseudomonadota bacterium]
MKRITMAGFSTMIPDHRADWDGWAEWERVRFESMAHNLIKDDVLYDVGAEYGDMSAIYAQMAGSLCLFESEPAVWRNIRHVWDASGLQPPRACYVGLVGEQTTDPVAQDFDGRIRAGWPECAWVDSIWPDWTFRYLHYASHVASTPQTRLDDWADRSGILPTVITMDIEGAELLALRGASRLLEQYHPMVYVSIHPDAMERDYHQSDADLHAYMRDLGYAGTHLGTDHEQHWAFTAGGRPLR